MNQDHPTPRREAGLFSLLPSGRGMLAQAGGFVLLGASLWLVGLLAFGRAVVAIFR